MSARVWSFCASLFATLLTTGCVVEDARGCGPSAMSAPTMVVVVDATTKAPICDATVQIVQGAPSKTLTPVAGKDGAPCGYTGATFGETDKGKTIGVYVTRAGYQDALVMATVEGKCHPETFSPTIALSK